MVLVALLASTYAVPKPEIAKLSGKVFIQPRNSTVHIRNSTDQFGNNEVQPRNGTEQLISETVHFSPETGQYSSVQKQCS